MRNHLLIAACVMTFLLAMMGTDLDAKVKMSKPTGIISTQDAIKAATKTIGDYVLTTHLFSGMGGDYYYRITVVDSEGEVKDVYVGGKSGKVRQVIEHPAEMRPPSAVEQ